MKKASVSLLFAAALALAGFSGTASAQDAGQAPGARQAPGAGEGRCHRGAPGARLERRLQHLTERLALDANQQAMVRQALEQARSEHEALRAQPRSQEQREQHRVIMQRAMERIDSVLTPEQRATLQQIRAERQERRGHRRGHHRGAPQAVEPRGI